MAKLTAPLMTPGPRKRLSDELHALHRRGGWPSVRELARAMGSGVASSSRIHDAFTKPRLPAWGLVEVLVAELACRVPGGAPADQEVKRFHDLWDAAAANAFPEVAAGLKVASKAAADGDHSEAIRLGTQLLTVSELAPDDPQSLELRHNLANWRGEEGDAAGAAAALADVVQDRSRVLGPDHTDTLESREELANWSGQAGDANGAAAALADLVQVRTRVQGANHPDTLTARHNAAHWRGDTGDAEGAAAAFADLVRDRTRLQGPDHPDTVASGEHLSHWKI